MTHEPLDAVADPDLRAALLFARSQVGPITADDVAVGLRLHRNVARARLDRLTAAGLLEVTHELVGEMVGSARETVTWAFAQLAREGFARREGRAYRLAVSPEALAS